jgi:hypothetical protein
MSNSSIIDYASIDIYELLRQRRQIAMIWSIEDVQEARDDLTEDQAWDVLQECERRGDAECGINWSYIDLIGGELFPNSRG